MGYADINIKRQKDKEYREKNKEKLKIYFKNRYEANKDVLLKVNKERYIRNREHNLTKMNEYYRKTKNQRKLYIESNREHIRKQDNIRYHRRLKNDLQFKIRRNLRSRFSKALIGIGVKSFKTMSLLGCTVDELKVHLEKQFKEGMSWENYGINGWHVDHIIPCASFDLSKPEEQAKCFHYTNLQPLWAKDNLQKGDKISILSKDNLEYVYSNQKQLDEYNNIQSKLGNFGPITNLNKIVLSNQPHFYEAENDLWRENKDNLRQWLVTNREKYIYKNEYELNDKEILRGFKISGRYVGFSHFNPLWVKAFIERYNISSIYDPVAGWGHRLLGACTIKYIGNDFDERTVNGLNNIIKTFDMKNKVIYNNDCRKFIPIENYEAIFTCPPYYNIEKYMKKTFKDMEDYDTFLYLMIKNSLKLSVKIIGIVVNHTYLDNVKNACQKNNLQWVEDIELGNRLNHFQRNSNITKQEILTIFKPIFACNSLSFC